ncbi:hypothetical protein MtrunA17_Chr6g0488411 [Medicago truncatula]|uniref:Uncharacterized protein n=1 Tax=Medicago truncatula TaxID=3880 RepID=A0A396HKL6_MEDTR|nr:hypothetical protein MtrunA17_Chr6g0488411 [Medicago truncatula]
MKHIGVIRLPCCLKIFIKVEMILHEASTIEVPVPQGAADLNLKNALDILLVGLAFITLPFLL